MTARKKKLDRWAEYVRELLNVEPPVSLLKDRTAEFYDLEIDLSSLTKNDVNEMLKAGGDKLIDWLLPICIALWTSERIPED